MPVPSLKDLATKACIKNINSLTDVGDLAFSQCHQVLRRIDSPAQLHLIETNSPQIANDTADLWQHFIARDIPNWRDKNFAPKDPSGWHRVYEKYKRQQEREIEKSREELRASLAGLKSKREANTSKVVDLRSLPKMPRDPRLVANGGNLLKRKTNGGWRKDGPGSSLAWTGGSKTKMTDGKSVLTRARREAKEISAMSKLARPTHLMGVGMGKVARAPTGLVDEYRRAARPMDPSGHVKILARKRTSNVSGRRELDEKEARLRALTSSTTYSPGALAGNVIDSDEDSDYALFDVIPPPKAQVAAPSRSEQPKHASSTRPSLSHAASTSTTLKPRPIARPAPSSSPARPGPQSHRSPSPLPPPRPMMKKRAPVDVFNRKVKKPRVV